MEHNEIRKIFESVKEFDWNKGNIDKNLIKHDVTCQEAEEVFINEPRIIFEDKEHSLIEKRYQILGITSKNRRLSVIFTIRKGKIRIISARDQNKRERKKYEKETKIYSKI